MAHEPEMCAKCLRVTNVTVDHIVPVVILKSIDDTGTAALEDEENFQFLCHPCNAFKGDMLDKANPKTKVIINKYL